MNAFDSRPFCIGNKIKKMRLIDAIVHLVQIYSEREKCSFFCIMQTLIGKSQQANRFQSLLREMIFKRKKDTLFVLLRTPLFCYIL